MNKSREDILFYIPNGAQDKIVLHSSLRKAIAEKIAIDCFEVPFYIYESLMRIVEYLNSNSEINDLSEIKIVHLLNYYYEQKKRGFPITFQQTIKDIKNLVIYLRDFKKIKNPPYINFSIQNHRLWNK